MSTTFKPYTYLIGWSSLNKFYYGVQFNKKANPDNLWNNYFTSSKYVKEFRELYGEPDIIQIRKTFTTKEQAIQWEFKIIQRLNCVRSEQWLNRSLAGQNFYCNGHSEETKKKISVANKGKNVSKNVGENNPNFSKKHSIETKQKMTIAKIGKQASLETKNKMSLSAKTRPKFECPHCHRFFIKSMLNRHHNNKCKQNLLFTSTTFI